VTEDKTFDVLHVLRLKGIAPTDVIAVHLEIAADDLQPILDPLSDQGLITMRETPRLSGWALTPAGRDRHAAAMAATRSPAVEAAIAPRYEEFLTLNGRVKAVSTGWQQLAPDDAAGRWEAIDELGEIGAAADGIVAAIAAIVPRFAWHQRRLAAALEHLRSGDERYFTGVTVDSFHTVWFECHEDLIQTLGRERIAEGSF